MGVMGVKRNVGMASLMPGYDKLEYLEPILAKLPPRLEDGPCVTHIGPGRRRSYFL